MLFKRSAAPVLAPDPSVDWMSGAVFNPGAWLDNGTVHMLFRAVPSGYRKIPVPGASPLESGFGFDKYVSSIGYASSMNGEDFAAREAPDIVPDRPFDRHGVEDPRISKIDDLYLITYTALGAPAFDHPGTVRIGLASTRDFRSFEKHGVIGPDAFDKDAVIFPRRIRGRIAMLHRIPPSIQLVYFDDVDQLCRPPTGLWAQHMAELDRHTILRPTFDWERKKIGAGPTPIETEAGWLLIYHGVDQDHVYRMGMALLDVDDPSRVIARTSRPVLEPEEPYERDGDVPNVVFPEGAVVIDGTLHVYYGAADRVIGHAQAPLQDVLDHLQAELAEAT